MKTIYLVVFFYDEIDPAAIFSDKKTAEKFAHVFTKDKYEYSIWEFKVDEYKEYVEKKYKPYNVYLDDNGKPTHADRCRFFDYSTDELFDLGDCWSIEVWAKNKKEAIKKAKRIFSNEKARVEKAIKEAMPIDCWKIDEV